MSPQTLPFPTLPLIAAPSSSFVSAPLPQAPVPNQIIIAFKPGTSEQERAAYIQSLGGAVKQSIDALNTVVVEVPAQASDSLLPSSDLVTSSEPDYYASAQIAVPPSDPFYGQQWTLPVIAAPQAWLSLPANAPKVTVAVIDSGIAFAPDGNSFVVSSAGNVVTQQEISTGALFQTFHTNGESIYAVAFSSDSKYLVTGSVDNTATLWDTTTGQEVYTLHGHSGAVRGTAFSPDGKYIVTGSSDRTMRLWDAAAGSIVRVLRGHRDAVWGVDFSKDSKFVLTGSLDHTANLWQVDYQDFVDAICARLVRDFPIMGGNSSQSQTTTPLVHTLFNQACPL